MSVCREISVVVVQVEEGQPLTYNVLLVALETYQLLSNLRAEN